MMKYKILYPFIILFAICIIWVCYFFLMKKDVNNNPTVNQVENNEKIVELSSDEIENLLNTMTLDEKIGQMLIVKVKGYSYSGDLKTLFNTIHPGGFILFGNNINTFEQTKTLIKDVKSNSRIPMIVAMDEEGGDVQKLLTIKDKKILSIPNMYDVGLTGDETIAYNIGTAIAKELKTIGVNVTNAPVLDIYSNPDNTVIGKRSFGTTPQLVSRMGMSIAKGLMDSGIMPVYKHFPGHGDTSVDSHDNIPYITKTYNEIKNFELIPFIDAINNNAQMIMVGHLAFPNITDNIPSSLSKTMITNILKSDLNYNGLVMTDALDMGALIKNYDNETIIKMAIDAGVDLLLMPKDNYVAFNYIKENVSEQRINESVYKILKFKKMYLKDYELLDESYLNNDEIKEIISNVYSNQNN